MGKKLASVRKVPWLLVFELARLTHGHIMDSTSPADRRKVMDILRRSHGDVRKLTPRDRDDLRAVATKLDVKRLAVALGPSLTRARRLR